jgi:FeS assembly SUF system protein
MPIISKDKIIEILKTIYDPEIPVSIYDLGLIYDININESSDVVIAMTLTAPNCPMADDLLTDVYHKINQMEGIKSLKINLIFDPPWDVSMLNEEAKLEMGLF